MPPRSGSTAAKVDMDAALVEAVPSTLRKFHTGKGAVLVRRVECFIPAIPFQTTPSPAPVARVLALGAKGMYVSEPDGTVVRVAVYDEVRRITSCLKYVALEFTGGRDALGISFTPFPENTSNNPEVVLKQFVQRCTKVAKLERTNNVSDIYYCRAAGSGVSDDATASLPQPSTFDAAAAAAGGMGGDSFANVSFADSVTKYLASPVRAAASSELQHDLQLPPEKWEAVLTKLYEEHNPAKVSSVHQLLEEFKGREVGLVLGIAKKYSISLDEVVDVCERTLIGEGAVSAVAAATRGPSTPPPAAVPTTTTTTTTTSSTAATAPSLARSTFGAESPGALVVAAANGTAAPLPSGKAKISYDSEEDVVAPRAQRLHGHRGRRHHATPPVATML